MLNCTEKIKKQRAMALSLVYKYNNEKYLQRG